jgi:hypothetical protein
LFQQHRLHPLLTEPLRDRLVERQRHHDQAVQPAGQRQAGQ